MVCSSLSAKAVALHFALPLVLSSGLQPLAIETDALQLVQELNSMSANIEVGLVISDTRVESLKMGIDILSFYPRDTNTVAHQMAKLALHFLSDTLQFHAFPDEISVNVGKNSVESSSSELRRKSKGLSVTCAPIIPEDAPLSNGSDKADGELNRIATTVARGLAFSQVPSDLSCPNKVMHQAFLNSEEHVAACSGNGPSHSPNPESLPPRLSPLAFLSGPIVKPSLAQCIDPSISFVPNSISTDPDEQASNQSIAKHLLVHGLRPVHSKSQTHKASLVRQMPLKGMRPLLHKGVGKPSRRRREANSARKKKRGQRLHQKEYQL
ncbi:hypothetical protein Ancab_023233 [Ancistrocladus abbreviatus]